MAKKHVVYVKQRTRERRNVRVLSACPATVARRAQHHYELIKRNIVDGCVSSTSIFDDEPGDVPDVFNQSITRFELADILLREGATKVSQKVASDGVNDVAE